MKDGGNDIYMQLLRFGEGWEDYWNIETVKDVKQFPNLKKATLCYAKENVVIVFSKWKMHSFTSRNAPPFH